MAKQTPPTTKQAQPAAKKLSAAEEQALLDKQWDDAAARAEAGDINRVKLEKGENIVRLLSTKFTENWVVFIQDTDGNDRRIAMGVDMAKNKEKYAHLFDTMPEAAPSHRYYFKAIQGKRVKTDKGFSTVLDNQVKLFEIGPSIFKQIVAIRAAAKAGEYPPIEKINLNITRTGEKKKTEYTVLPAAKETPMPKELVGDVDLEILTQQTTLESVYEILGETYTGEEESGYTEEAPTEETTTDIPLEEEATQEAEPEMEAESEVEDDGLNAMSRAELKTYIKESLADAFVVYKEQANGDWSDDFIRNKIREYWAEHPELFGSPEPEPEPEPEMEAEPEAETAVADDAVVEEDDLSSLDDLENLSPEPAKAPVKAPAKAPVKAGTKPPVKK